MKSNQTSVFKTIGIVVGRAAAIMLLSGGLPAAAQVKPHADPGVATGGQRVIQNERQKYAQQMFQQYPELFPESRRALILNGVVSLGMTPFEARLAGGAFYFSVSADRSRWPEHSDPYKVMWAQSTRPDNSKISMTFQTETQFPEAGKVSFRVDFEHGKAVKIEKLAR